MSLNIHASLYNRKVKLILKNLVMFLRMFQVRETKKLLEASETSSVDLLLEMKKIRGNNKINHDLPDDVGGAKGEANIVEKFCEVYEELYNSSGSEEALHSIKAHLEELIAGSETGENEVLKVVKQAASKMKPGKVM